MIEDKGSLDCIRITAPHWWSDPGFLQWLNSSATATWHAAGDEPHEYSDCFILFDNGEGADAPIDQYLPSDKQIPPYLWEELTQFLESEGIRYCIVWLLSYDQGQKSMSEHQKMQLLQSWQARHPSDSPSD
jgi:hypothetical protein